MMVQTTEAIDPTQSQSQSQSQSQPQPQPQLQPQPQAQSVRVSPPAVELDPAVIEAERLDSFINTLINNSTTTTTATTTNNNNNNNNNNNKTNKTENTPILISNEELAQQQQQQQQQHLGRGKKWQPEEDEQLSRAWLKVSEENPAGSSTSTDQRSVHDTFWNRVSDEFLRSSPGSRRPPRSIQQRWAKLHQSISQFGECYEEQESRLRSAGMETEEAGAEGSMAERVLIEAMKQYKQRTEQNFIHYTCWTILRDRKQWTEHLAKPRMMPLKRKLTATDDLQATENEPGTLLHPSLVAHPFPATASTAATHTHEAVDIPTRPALPLLPPSKTLKLTPSSSSTHQPQPQPALPPPQQAPQHPPPPSPSSSPSSSSPPPPELMALNEKRLTLIQDLVDSIKEKNRLLSQFNQLERETNQIKIMAQFNSDESQLWFKLKQQEILNEFNLNILS
ncbi:hypothetical protein PGTUg99_007177 [Puccinia graminis f. sp. tritici]|uniref:Myb-like domain-containing protein n=1 Tax=Puccinia graminis f. sp. tritici TaxID=56615 RepID=A0A5B0RXF4_PUCGR|nr:hypothetical protein PGTUg99_007177 [Puccinia graminis f. sp. tritici]